jgi:glycerate 2-kinase
MIMTEQQTLITIFRAALQSVDPYEAVARYTDEIGRTYDKGKYERLCVVAFGKAASTMMQAVTDHFGEVVTGGIVITKYGHANSVAENRGVRVFQAAHPVPDEKGYQATREVLRFLEHSDDRTLLICLISGGGSSLLVAPYCGISLEDKQKTTELLLRSGADIYEMNTVRKHISHVKGGRLAAIAYPSRIESLILSDVLGDRLDVIASGPTVPDKTTYGDALSVIEKYQMGRDVPASVLDLLRRGVRGLIPETPNQGDPVFQAVRNRIVGNNVKAIEAMREKAEQLGFDVTVINTGIHGEAREVGLWFARETLAAKKALAQRPEHCRPVCLISGGETTVTVQGHGVGGRNMELALAFAIEVDGQSGITFLSAGTDGGDGPTDAAGAIVDGLSAAKGRATGIDPRKCLQNNDSYSYFSKTNELLVTGPTGTNVMDLQIALLHP